MSGLAAFLFNIGGQELFLLLVIGVLLFGRNLPQVGRTLGRTVAQLRRGFQEFKDQMDRDESLREVKDTIHQARRVSAVPKAVVNPGQMLKDLTNEALYSPPPEEERRTVPGADDPPANAADPGSEVRPSS